MKRTLIALALLVVPAVAQAQSVALAGSSRSNSLAPHRPRMTAEVRARIEASIVAAGERGTPTAPMRRLAAEGEARLASESRIMMALSRLESSLQTAKGAFVKQGRTPTDGEVLAGAEALAQGASAAQLESVIRSAPEGRSLEVSLTTLSALASRGEAVAEAAAAIERRLASRVSDEQIAALAGGQ